MLSRILGTFIVILPTAWLALRHLPSRYKQTTTADWFGVALLAAYALFVLADGLGNLPFRTGTNLTFKYLLPSISFTLLVFPHFLALEAASPWRRDTTTPAMFRVVGYTVLLSTAGLLLAAHG